MRAILLLLVSIYVGEATADHNSNQTSRCPVNMTAPVDLGAKPNKKGCFDLEGGGPYFDGQYYPNTNCVAYMCVSNGKKGKKEKYSWTMEDTLTCCIVGDDYYEYGCIVRSEQQGPCTTLNFICEWDSAANQMAVMPDLNVTGCSVSGECLPYGVDHYWPEKCAHLHCVEEFSGPTFQYHEQHEGCDCCLFEDMYGHKELIEDGGYVYDSDGHRIECCNGDLKYVFPFTPNGTLPWGPGTETTGSTSSTTASTSSTTASTSSTTGSTSTSDWSEWSEPWSGWSGSWSGWSGSWSGWSGSWSGWSGTNNWSGWSGSWSGWSGSWSGWSGSWSGWSGSWSGWSGTNNWSGWSGSWSGWSGSWSGWSGSWSGWSGSWSGWSGSNNWSGWSGSWSGWSGSWSGWSGSNNWSGWSGSWSGWSGSNNWSGWSGSWSGWSGSNNWSGWSGSNNWSGWSGTNSWTGWSGSEWSEW